MTTPPTACYCRDCRPETLALFERRIRLPLVLARGALLEVAIEARDYLRTVFEPCEPGCECVLCHLVETIEEVERSEG